MYRTFWSIHAICEYYKYRYFLIYTCYVGILHVSVLSDLYMQFVNITSIGTFWIIHAMRVYYMYWYFLNYTCYVGILYVSVLSDLYMLSGYLTCISSFSCNTRWKNASQLPKTQVNFYFKFKTMYFELSEWEIQGNKSGGWGGGGWEMAGLTPRGLKSTGIHHITAKETCWSGHHWIK